MGELKTHFNTKNVSKKWACKQSIFNTKKSPLMFNKKRGLDFFSISILSLQKCGSILSAQKTKFLPW